MRKAIVGSLLLSAGLGLAAAAAQGPHAAEIERSATGKGNFRFGHDDQSTAMFDFELFHGAAASGKLLFAAEDHDHYPDVIVRVPRIRAAAFDGQTVTFRAPGKLHDDAVTVIVSAFDGSASGGLDWFSIRCVGAANQVVFEARGDLFRGDIQIGTPE
jgi:hypothetical protein